MARIFQSERIPFSKKVAEISLGEELFQTSQSLEIEIGAGTGDFAIQYAEKNPKSILLAIEHTKTRFKKFHNKLNDQMHLPNLKPIHANAIGFITHRIKTESVDHYWILYPNPYPKKKDLNKRWYAMSFFSFLIETLKPAGQITLATNEYFYFEQACEFFENAWNLCSIEKMSFDLISRPSGYPRTLFEKKYLERGEVCYEVRARKWKTTTPKKLI